MVKNIFAVLVSACALAAQSAPAPAQKAAAAPRETTPRFDVNLIDRSVNPCDNFYQYACGGWMKDNPIPPDQAIWGRFEELAERNRDILHQILEQAAAPVSEDAISRQIGDFYAACMDEKPIDAKGLAPLEPLLARIRALSDKAQIAADLARLQVAGVDALFDFSSGQDFKDSQAVIAQADQGGLGLPDRDYYLKEDAKTVELRQKYVAHVQRMLDLAGEKPEKAKADAATVMRIETGLAKGSLDLVSRRDPEKVYHKMGKPELGGSPPPSVGINTSRTSGAPAFQSINVAYPDFVRTFNAAIENAPLADWKTYLTWHLLHVPRRCCPRRSSSENFDFYGKTLTGAEAMRPRWKRCVDFTDRELGEALGPQIRRADLRRRRQGAHPENGGMRSRRRWARISRCSTGCTPATKAQALIKLKAITNKIGYPDRWRDYSSVVIKRDDPLATVSAPTSSSSIAS